MLFRFSAQDLRASSAKRCQTLPHDQKYVLPPQKKLNPKIFRVILGNFIQLHTSVTNISTTRTLDINRILNTGSVARQQVAIDAENYRQNSDGQSLQVLDADYEAQNCNYAPKFPPNEGFPLQFLHFKTKIFQGKDFFTTQNLGKGQS